EGESGEAEAQSGTPERGQLEAAEANSDEVGSSQHHSQREHCQGPSSRRFQRVAHLASLGSPLPSESPYPGLRAAVVPCAIFLHHEKPSTRPNGSFRTLEVRRACTSRVRKSTFRPLTQIPSRSRGCSTRPSSQPPMWLRQCGHHRRWWQGPP